MTSGDGGSGEKQPVTGEMSPLLMSSQVPVLQAQQRLPLWCSPRYPPRRSSRLNTGHAPQFLFCVRMSRQQTLLSSILSRGKQDRACSRAPFAKSEVHPRVRCRRGVHAAESERCSGERCHRSSGCHSSAQKEDRSHYWTVRGGKPAEGGPVCIACFASWRSQKNRRLVLRCGRRPRHATSRESHGAVRLSSVPE